MSSTNGSRRYTVSIPDAILQQLKAWGELARRVNRSSDYLAAVRELRDQLEHSPTAWVIR